MLRSNISSICLHNIVNFGPLAVEMGPVVWGTPANFNKFCVLAALPVLHGTPVVSAKLCGVEQRAPPIFGRVAITLGIGPHSSLVVFLQLLLLLLLLITTSGQSDLTKDCRLQFNRIHQVAPMYPPMWSHWRHLANTIELVLPSVYAGLQPNQQIDRFSHFCTAHGRVYSGTLASPGEYD